MLYKRFLKSRIICIVLLNLFMHVSSCFANVYFAAFTRNLILYSTLFLWINSILRLDKCDLSVVWNLKKDRMPCCCRQ